MMLVRVTTDLPQRMDEELDALVAVGLYKSKSEALRDALRDLVFKYKDKIVDVAEVRKETSGIKGKLSDSVMEDRA